MPPLCPIHLAFLVLDLAATGEARAVSVNVMDDHGASVRHSGVVLPMKTWQALTNKLRNCL
jgi:extradiol dioxygenase family protein